MNKAAYVEMMGRQCESDLRAIGIAISPVRSYSPNYRATNRAGACKLTRNENTGWRTVFDINISDILCDGNHDLMLRSTLYHELVHTVNGCQNHGKLFQSICREISDCYDVPMSNRVRMESLYTPEECERIRAKKMRYAVRCKKCGKIIYRQNRVALIQHPENYTHTYCGGGQLERIK